MPELISAPNHKAAAASSKTNNGIAAVEMHAGDTSSGALPWPVFVYMYVCLSYKFSFIHDTT